MKNTIFVLILYLLICSVMDIKEKKIPVGILYIGFIIGIVNFTLLLFCEERNYLDFIFVIMPGMILFILSKISKGIVGEADGLLFMISGLFFTMYQIIFLFVAAFFCSFIVSCFLLLVKKAGRKSQIPFVPFIFVSTLFVGYIK